MSIFGWTMRLVRHGRRPVVTCEWGCDAPKQRSVSPDPTSEERALERLLRDLRQNTG